jgi:hypothetical protein
MKAMNTELEYYTKDKRALNVMREFSNYYCGGMPLFIDELEEFSIRRGVSTEDAILMMSNCGKRTMPIIIDAVNKFKEENKDYKSVIMLFIEKVSSLATEMGINQDLIVSAMSYVMRQKDQPSFKQ